MSSDDSKADASVNAKTGQLSQKSRWIAFWFVLAIGVAWWLTLSWLVVKTANPVTLNRLQVLTADVVVVAELVDVASGKLTVIETYHGEKLPDSSELYLPELRSAKLKAGDRLLLPLSKNSTSGGSPANAFSITPNLIESGKPLFYPANDEAILQLQELLASTKSDN